MSDFMWKGRKEVESKENKNLDQKVLQMAERKGMERRIDRGSVWDFGENRGATGFAVQERLRQPRYYMEEGQVIQLQPNVRAADDFAHKDNPNFPLQLPQSVNKPTMVFETMGTQMTDCNAIFEESCKYEGNTICVFGLNMEVEDLNASSEWLTAEIDGWERPTISPQYSHLLYVFKFVWKKPEGLRDANYYVMPYAEARLQVMQKAKKIVGEKPNETVLYRWIDADARNDTLNQIPVDILQSLAYKEVPNENKPEYERFLTGRYDWRHNEKETESNMKEYHSFIVKLNDAEKQLRDRYHELARWRLKQMTDENQVDQRAFNDGNGSYSKSLDGLYLPETVLVMNQAAHDKLVWNSYSEEGVQDKESTRLVSKVPGECESRMNRIMYSSDFRAEKPLKAEFKQGTYLGRELHNFFVERTTDDKTQFFVALNNVRQSAFGKWYFYYDSDWKKWEGWQKKSDLTDPDKMQQNEFNDKKNETAEGLWGYLSEVKTIAATRQHKEEKKSRLQIIRDSFKGKGILKI